MSNAVKISQYIKEKKAAGIKKIRILDTNNYLWENGIATALMEYFYYDNISNGIVIHLTKPNAKTHE